MYACSNTDGDIHRTPGINEYSSYGKVEPSSTEQAPKGTQCKPVPIVATYNEALPNIISAPTNEAYNFKYYRLASQSDNFKDHFVDGWGRLYENGVEPGSTNKWEIDTNSPYYLIGIWEPKQFKLIADYNGGDSWEILPPDWGISVDQICSKDVYYKDPFGNLPKPKKTGFIFIGWATTKDATIKNINESTIFNKVGSITIYAIWKPGTEVVLKGNGGLYPGSITEDTIVLEYGKENNEYKELTNTPRLAGYTLDGFYLDSENWEYPLYLWEDYTKVKYYGSDSQEGPPGQEGPYWDSTGIWKYNKTSKLVAWAKWSKTNSYVSLGDRYHEIKYSYVYTPDGWKLITGKHVNTNGTDWGIIEEV